MTAFETLPRLNVPPTLVIGGGASRGVGKEARRLGVSNALVVTDPYFREAGLAQRVVEDLNTENVRGVVFSEVTPDPTVENVQAGLEHFKRSQCDGVVAIGGGSSIDAAKAIAVLSKNPGGIGDYQGYHKVPHSGVPLIAIPTTAGTGSEVTKVSVITDTQRNVKMLIVDFHLLPSVALVDFELTLSMPPKLTAAVGLDSLTHAIEAYVSKKASHLTDLLALEAGRLIRQNIRTAFAEPGNREAREAMMRGATIAGIAFSNASVALVHGMARPLGANFHVPHGLSNAMLLPVVTAFSINGAPHRYACIARAMGFSQSADDQIAGQDLIKGLKELNRVLGIPSLRGYGVGKEHFEKVISKMAQDALASGSPGFNPLVPTAEQIVDLYRQAYE